MTIDAKLWVPNEVWVNRMPPVPRRVIVSVPVAAFLTNRGADDETLTVPTPCDVHNWEIRDTDGRVIEAEPLEYCAQVIESTLIPAGRTIRGDNVLRLDGQRLVDGERYTVVYEFWGQKAEDVFLARVAV